MFGAQSSKIITRNSLFQCPASPKENLPTRIRSHSESNVTEIADQPEPEKIVAVISPFFLKTARLTEATFVSIIIATYLPPTLNQLLIVARQPRDSIGSMQPRDSTSSLGFEATGVYRTLVLGDNNDASCDAEIDAALDKAATAFVALKP